MRASTHIHTHCNIHTRAYTANGCRSGEPKAKLPTNNWKHFTTRKENKPNDDKVATSTATHSDAVWAAYGIYLYVVCNIYQLISVADQGLINVSRRWRKTRQRTIHRFRNTKLVAKLNLKFLLEFRTQILRLYFVDYGIQIVTCRRG